MQPEMLPWAWRGSARRFYGVPTVGGRQPGPSIDFLLSMPRPPPNYRVLIVPAGPPLFAARNLKNPAPGHLGGVDSLPRPIVDQAAASWLAS